MECYVCWSLHAAKPQNDFWKKNKKKYKSKRVLWFLDCLENENNAISLCFSRFHSLCLSLPLVDFVLFVRYVYKKVCGRSTHCTHFIYLTLFFFLSSSSFQSLPLYISFLVFIFLFLFFLLHLTKTSNILQIHIQKSFLCSFSFALCCCLILPLLLLYFYADTF